MNIEEKIRIARDLQENWSTVLLASAAVSSQLSELKTAVSASSKSSVESGLTETCGSCDKDEGGSCCGAGIENRYTSEMLLINLLLGADLPESRRSDNSCYFLGDQGCLLSARDIICVNYLCARLQKEIPCNQLLRLQEVTGREMETLFRLHNTIKNLIRTEGRIKGV